MLPRHSSRDIWRSPPRERGLGAAPLATDAAGEERRLAASQERSRPRDSESFLTVGPGSCSGPPNPSLLHYIVDCHVASPPVRRRSGQPIVVTVLELKSR